MAITMLDVSNGGLHRSFDIRPDCAGNVLKKWVGKGEVVTAVTYGKEGGGRG